MKPAAFAYERPTRLDDALALMQTPGATPLAGGQSLVPRMNLRRAEPACIVDLNALEELAYVREEGGALVLGALARQRDVERSDLARRLCPLLGAALRHVGTVQTRNRGTVAGSLAFADPAAELGAVAVAAGAVVVLASTRGRRELPASEFLVGPFRTARALDELVVEVRVPALAAGGGCAFEELARGFSARPLVAAAAVVDARGARAAVVGVAGTPVTVSSPDALPAAPDRFLRAAAGELVVRVLRRAHEARRAA